MPHTSPSTILSVLATVLMLGCNSHASFPENNGNNANNTNNTNNQQCSNGVLEPGEACDLDHALTHLFQEGDSCEQRGYAGGTLVCEPASCQVITSECIPAGGCNPIDNAGCDGDTCFYSWQTDNTSCSMAGSANEGEHCTASPDCQAGMTCWENFCRRVCTPDSICPDGVNTCITMDWLGGNLGVCPLDSGPCNPANGSGCSGGYACYLDRSTFNGYCAPEGSGGLGSTCVVDTDCYGGHACLKYEDPAQGYCVPLCDSTFDFCNEGSAWCAYSTGGTVGFCTQNDGCDPKSGASCGAGQYCTVTNPYGSFSCLVPGTVAENEFCDMFNLCSQGLFCAVEYDFKCHRPCEANSDCTVGDECITVPGWTDLNQWTGYCRLP